ncbi:MAG: hypothetical protein R3C15_18335 [Thermoleophilia bacterium]
MGGETASTCPRCGAVVPAPAAGVGLVAGAQVHEPETQDARCPGCGARLRRSAGGRWTLDER